MGRDWSNNGEPSMTRLHTRFWENGMCIKNVRTRGRLVLWITRFAGGGRGAGMLRDFLENSGARTNENEDLVGIIPAKKWENFQWQKQTWRNASREVRMAREMCGEQIVRTVTVQRFRSKQFRGVFTLNNRQEQGNLKWRRDWNFCTKFKAAFPRWFFIKIYPEIIVRLFAAIV